MVMVFTKW